MHWIVLGCVIAAVTCAKHSLKLTDCNNSPNKLIHLANADLAVDPVHIPGRETGKIDVEILRPISGSHYKLDVVVQKHVIFGFVKVPCVNRVGSCSYELCDLLSGSSYHNVHHCPLNIAESSPDFPCACPFDAGSYHLNATTFKIPAMSGIYKSLASGDYKIDVTITDTHAHEQVACFHIKLSVAAAGCSGLSCIFG